MMKTKFRTSPENKQVAKIDKLLKNNNFRNSQNYVFSVTKGNKIILTYNSSVNLDDFFKIYSSNKGIKKIFIPSLNKNINFLHREEVNWTKNTLKSQKNFLIISLIFMLIFPILLGFSIGFKVVMISYFMYFFAFFMFYFFVKIDNSKIDKKNEIEEKDVFDDINNYIYLREKEGIYFFHK